MNQAKGKILVVDDEAKIRALIRKYAEYEGYTVAEAADGMEAVSKAKAEDFDIIILDIMMPELDGIETLHRMRSMGDIPCKDMPVIILTANAVTGAREEYLEEGFTDFLAKPIDSTHLEKMLCTYLPK